MRTFEIVTRCYTECVRAVDEEAARRLFSAAHPARAILYVIEIKGMNNEDINKR